ncbi:MAG: hypothetical protein NTU53_16820 [Planctomycetota bacterium]|nr:hypothetical protein [Planctomycetota bacterium]
MRSLRTTLVLFLSLGLASCGCRSIHHDQAKAVPVMSFEEYGRTPLPPVPYVISLSDGKGQLFYFGARHMFDPADWQVQAIEDFWHHYRPTLAFNEGGEPPVMPSRDETVSRFGEAGLVRHLAKRDGVAVRSLEPSREAEYALLLEVFSEEQIKVFYVLRGVAQFRKSRNDETPEAFVAKVLAGFGGEPRLQGPPRSLAEFERSYARLLAEPADWRTAPDGWFDPAATEKGQFTNWISRRLSEFRDRHMVGLLTGEVRKGARVFAVVGGSHVIMQERALRAAFRTPSNE